MSLETKITKITAAGFTAMRLGGQEDGSCFCAIHKKVVFGKEDGVGCEKLPHGTHESIAALYSERSNRYCHAELGVRVLDGKFAAFAYNARAFACLGGDYKPIMKYVKGSHAGLPRFGSGYCYMEAVIPEARVRVARVLGPLPYMVDWLRVICVVGRVEIDEWSLEEVKVGSWHLESISSNKVAARGLVERIVEILDTQPKARIGVKSEDFAALHKFARDRGLDVDSLNVLVSKLGGVTDLRLNRCQGVFGGLPDGLSMPSFVDVNGVAEVTDVEKLLWQDYEIKLPSEARGYFQMLEVSSMTQNCAIVKGRSVIRLLAQCGDAVLRMWFTTQLMVPDMNHSEMGAAQEKVSNAALAVVFDRSCFSVFSHVASSVGEKGTFIEALVGIVYGYKGYETAFLLAKRLMLVD